MLQVCMLVSDTLSTAAKGAGAVGTLGAGAVEERLQSGNKAQDLERVVSWLMLNGMVSEQTQADMLLCQNLDNLPRKFGYRSLLQRALAGRGEALEAGEVRLLKGWVLEVNLEVANKVLCKVPHAARYWPLLL